MSPIAGRRRVVSRAALSCAAFALALPEPKGALEVTYYYLPG